MILDKINNSSESKEVNFGERAYKFYKGVLKPKEIETTSAQKQTQETFGFKWKKEYTFNSSASLDRMKKWLFERYDSPEKWINKAPSKVPFVLDAGCGAGMSGFEYWGDVFDKIKYFGVDISEAVEVAKKRYEEKGLSSGYFLQESIDNLPFDGPEFDIIFSEGVLHHTDNTKRTFTHLCQFLKQGGLFMFYIYRKKGPIREFTDDYIRNHLQNVSSEEGWNMLKGLTSIGIELGKLGIEIDIPEEVKPLEIPAGKISLQRLFYWHVFKSFYDEKLSFDEMHHINFDWYAPKNAHRHTVEQVRSWCDENGLEIQHEVEELAGITCIARKI